MARAKKKSAKVQRYRARDCFAKKIGKHRGEDGQLRPKVWYFTGVGEEEAIARALALKADWRRLKAEGLDEWPSEYVPPFKTDAWRSNGSNGQAEQAARIGRRVRLDSLLLKDCLKLYKADLEAQERAGRISPARVRNACAFAKRGVDFLGEASPLDSINRQRLIELVNYFCSRPKTKAGTPMAEESVKSHVSNCSTFFRWIDKHERIPWTRPENFEDIWSVGSLKPISEEERKAKYLERTGKGLRLFTVNELKKLYKAATVEERAWLLLGLNCAFQNIDVSDLRTYEVHDGKVGKIIREREKTGVEGRWVLWPETLKAIRAAQAPPNEHERVFLAPTGGLLVPRHTRHDHIQIKWSELRERAGLDDAPSFKFLRKTSADAIKQLSGSDEISKLHRCHTEENPLAVNYTNRLWPQVHEWQTKLRSVFAAVWKA